MQRTQSYFAVKLSLVFSPNIFKWMKIWIIGMIRWYVDGRYFLPPHSEDSSWHRQAAEQMQ